MRLVPVLLAACLSLALVSVQAATGNQTDKGKTSQSKSSNKAKATPSAKTTKTTKSPKSNKAKASAKSNTTATNCSKNKSAKGCVGAKSEPVAKTLRSPITADSLEKAGPTAGDELKARTVPDRAYAIDGQTFFHQGRRIRIEGLSSATATATGEHAKQRLQTLLDSGNISIEQIAIDDTGVATAQVRVNGRDLANQLNGGN